MSHAAPAQPGEQTQDTWLSSDDGVQMPCEEHGMVQRSGVSWSRGDKLRRAVGCPNMWARIRVDMRATHLTRRIRYHRIPLPAAHGLESHPTALAPVQQQHTIQGEGKGSPNHSMTSLLPGASARHRRAGEGTPMGNRAGGRWRYPTCWISSR